MTRIKENSERRNRCYNAMKKRKKEEVIGRRESDREDGIGSR